ncbi:hypothetical protein H8356DRAFT_1684728 [Neocallimastix lanati (nom. inval.)]|jgi:molybdenum cofactor cytidylyltransferase|uniref:Uncharacterized protein n=1 Tax=Neocallimastix californiae TaxID=1754190 RepID=A0A1Y2AN72_9FUNG|nr:hypothetical protein H8356DRAFT_1684728 [Neocallimastix sp. JGI-2020a]ORY23750.1 hypothetical protein LY90DRAFT_706791 [Neocallimastix californiae]|eukprot:ORY23750.1 hypothetical protein LY90DRAFT_706791 [Neocallimastix californiae]
MTKVSIIFEERPVQWGLRGDPYFWDYLEEKFESYELPMEYTELEKIIKEEYLKLTNVELTDTSYGYNEKMAHGGMSSGQIDGRFWMTKGLPLLKSRLTNYTN